MDKNLLIKRLKDLGYPLFDSSSIVNGNEVLAEIAKSKEPRFWEGFPIVLAHLLDTKKFNYDKMKEYLDGQKHRINLHFLLTVSFALFRFLGLKTKPPSQLIKNGSVNNNGITDFQLNFKKSVEISGGDIKLSPSRLITAFKNYTAQPKWNVRDYLALKDDFDLEHSLSQIFSRKQRELLFKRLHGEKMTKTEQEYYSRSVKKKLIALANPDLHKLASKLINR